MKLLNKRLSCLPKHKLNVIHEEREINTNFSHDKDL